MVKYNLKLLILDVDGVLTNGLIFFDNQENEYKAFNVKDGLAIRVLSELQILKFAIITGRTSKIVEKRAKELLIKDVFQGYRNKLVAYNVLKEKYKLKDSEIGFIGDDLNDLPLIERVAFFACPTDAPKYIKEKAHFVSSKKGGQGAVREILEFLVPNFYEIAKNYFSNSSF
ncbi:MAG TPA: 3-deoxy-D-manno-octulosonate 8-phosphate phosphatase [Desulfurobacteriaceae bacterium]|nr:3-deoxy-D-manno-octulosonate 8-phosphate phosphatase [Desulfurobacteriaceae bacterium]